MKIKYRIFQVPVGCDYCFMDFKFAMEHKCNRRDYVHVYDGEFESETVNKALDEIFCLLNMCYPEDYHARSLSVSDVVTINGTPYYCDSFGWSELPDEWRK